MTHSASPSPALRGYEGIPRHFDGRLNSVVARISVGEHFVTSAGDVIATVLGSCVCACIRDPISKIGGMNHFLLPGGTSSGAEASALEQRFGVASMEMLINGLLKNGAERSRLEVKLFGGSIMHGSVSQIGAQNAAFAETFVANEGLTLAAKDFGGPHPRRVLYKPASGQVWVNYLKLDQARGDLEREANFAARFEETSSDGEVELFN